MMITPGWGGGNTKNTQSPRPPPAVPVRGPAWGGALVCAMDAGDEEFWESEYSNRASDIRDPFDWFFSYSDIEYER